MAFIAQPDIDRNNPFIALVLDFLEQVFQVETHEVHQLQINIEETFDSRFRMKEDLYPPLRWSKYDAKIHIQPAIAIGEDFHLLIKRQDNTYTIESLGFPLPGWMPKKSTPKP